MKKLDRYILSKYFTTFFFCLLLLTAIVVVVDMSEKTEDFVRSKLSAYKIFTDYYLAFIPHIDAMLFPLFVFISVIFFTSKMAGRSEVIAILSSGVSLKRFLLPYAVGGTMLALLLWFGYQYLVPVANGKWADFEKTYINIFVDPNSSNSSYKQHLYFRLDSNSYASINGYDTISKSGTNLSVSRIEKNKLTYNLRANRFTWDTAIKKWTLYNVMERKVNTIDESVVYAQQVSKVFSFSPSDLRKDNYLKDQMTSSELKDFIKKEKMRGSEMLSTLQVELYNRDAIPFSVLILTIIGAILACRKDRGGSGIHLALGVVISVLYILLSRLTVVFATKGNFSPWLAAWLPNLIFGWLAVYLYKRAPK